MGWFPVGGEEIEGADFLLPPPPCPPQQKWCWIVTDPPPPARSTPFALSLQASTWRTGSPPTETGRALDVETHMVTQQVVLLS